jgi:hypothetical protein
MYESLEYEQALEKLTRARNHVRDLDEDALISFYEGIVLADLNRREQAKAAFRSGLLLKPEARLPMQVSPKVEQDFEAVRTNVRRELALQQTQATAQPTGNTKQPLKPGEQANLHLKLDTETHAAAYQRQWTTWMPWALMGSGLAVVAGGGLLHKQSIKGYRAYDAGIVQCGGCVPEAGLMTNRTRADTLQNVAYGTYALGGAALVGGAVLLYLNQSQPYHTSPTTGEEAVNVTPLIGDSSGLLATFRF